jgi:UTP:GlnB (protein PII) uridylyltransferase
MTVIEKKVIEQFKLLLLNKAKLYSMILFGSRARGDADPYSDMDIVVVVEDLTDEVERHISDCAWEAGFEQGVVVVPIVFSRYQWESGPERFLLVAQAAKEGGVLV